VLPHRYPFRFVEEVAPGGPVTVAVSHVSPWLQRAPSLGLALAIEIMAQAAHVLLEGGPTVYLAGVENAELFSEIEPGDRLQAHASALAGFGGMTKVATSLARQDDPVAQATLILVNGAANG